MSTWASILNHPIHPMLIVFPLGLWIFSFVALIVAAMTDLGSWDVAGT